MFVFHNKAGGDIASSPFFYFTGHSLGDRWREWIISKYSQSIEIEFFLKEVDKGLKSFEEKFLVKHLKPGAGVLDIGCGVGREAIALARKGYKIVGIDISPRSVEIARQKAQEMKITVDYQIGEAGNLKFNDNSFDYVLMIAQLIHHIHGRKNRIRALSEAWRVLRPGGGLILTIRNRIGVTKGLILNFLYRSIKGLRRLQNLNGKNERNPYGITNPGLWRNAFHGLYLRLLSIGVDSWRKAVMEIDRFLKIEYKGREPGDYLIPHVSPAISSGLMTFHCYSLQEIIADLSSAGFEIEEYRDTSELDLGLEFPEWARNGARYLILYCKKVHKV